MIMSIRYMQGKWKWELYSVGKEGNTVTGKFSAGEADTFKEMVSNLEFACTELERRNEFSGKQERS